MKVDVHGFELDGALLEIYMALEQCRLDGDETIEIVHGFHNGEVIKTYLGTPKFKKQVEAQGFFLTRVASIKGSTTFRIS
jgi:hypothetical protein